MQTQIQVLSEDEKAQVHERTLEGAEHRRHALRHRRGAPDPGRRRRRCRRGDAPGPLPRRAGREPAGAGDAVVHGAGPPAGLELPRRRGRVHAAGRRRRDVRGRRRDRGAPPDERRRLARRDPTARRARRRRLLLVPHRLHAPTTSVPAASCATTPTCSRTFGKHVQDSFGTPELAPWLKEVLDIVFGGPEQVRERMPLSFLITPASPLTIEHDYTQTWLELRDYGLPVAVMPMPLQGATAPGSRLGTLLAANCETIGTLCLVQAAAPGHAGLLLAGGGDHGPAHRALRRRRRRARRALRRRHRDGPLLRPAGRVLGPLHADLRAGPADRLGEGRRRPARRPSPTPTSSSGRACSAARRSSASSRSSWTSRSSAAPARRKTGVPVRDDLWLDEVLDKVGPCGSFLGERSTRTGVHAGEWALSDFGVQGTLGRVAGGGVADHRRRRPRARRRSILAEQVSLPYSDDQAAALAALQRRADAAS